MDAAGTNKSITRQELQTYNAGTLTTDVKVLDLSATWNGGAVTFTGLKFNVTDTASAAASLLLDLQVGGTWQVRLDKARNWRANGVFYWSTSSDISFHAFDGGTPGNGNKVLVVSADIRACNSKPFSLSSNHSTADIFLHRDAAATLAQRNGTNAQTFRLYNTFTDASNYERLGINWGSNIVSIKPEAAGTGTVRVLHISGLPTSNPGAGILWNDSNTVKVGT
jgi:hypothetical protein